MPKYLSFLNTLSLTARWLLLAIASGILAGTASAILLASLNWATDTRESHRWIIALLPIAGLAVGLMYHYLGRRVEAGNNLILEEIHAEADVPASTIPFRMTPLILLGTFITHLFGGSAGREGTAIQTGASLTDQITLILRRFIPFSEHDRRILLMAGISAGFGSVFGTPLAGAVFGLEVLSVDAFAYDAIFPCFAASFAADYVTARILPAWRIHHTVYTVTQTAPLTARNMLAAIAAGIAFGLCALAFARTTHAIGRVFKQRIAFAPLRPFIGGAIVAIAVFAIGTTKYIGLGIPTIVASLSQHLPRYDFAAKFAFTTITLGSGFKGGEVTPLFFIGSTLGNALSSILPLPSSLLAAMGFVAVFSGAANTPIAGSLMALELFGTEAGAFAAIACVISYLFSGHAGIYHAQRIRKSKHGAPSIEKPSIENSSASIQIPLESINEFGYIGGTNMEHLGVVRLYFSASEMRQADSFWKRFVPQALGAFLLKQAKDHGIEQALLHRVIGGYLKGQDLVMDTGEIPPARLPQCLELVGDEEDLHSFIKHNRDHLKRVRIVFLHGKEAEFEAAIEREELENALEIEHSKDFISTNPED